MHVNEAIGGSETAAYLLTYDSIHGTWREHNVENGSDDASFTVDGRTVKFSADTSPSSVSWDVDIVCDCTGKFLSWDALSPYLSNGAKKVVVSAPVKGDDRVLNVVMGCNDDLLADHAMCTAASCTTNCLAPVVKVIKENLGIKHGVITTVHDVTGTQPIIDMPMTKKKDLRRCRSGMTNLAPTTTGSATAITVIYPELKGKLNGIAVRVPMLNASITDCVFEVERETTVEEVNGLIKAAATEGPLKGILGFETKPLVSSDYVNDVRSSIVDAATTMVVDGTCVKLLCWYDNGEHYPGTPLVAALRCGLNIGSPTILASIFSEAGYSMRMAELVAKVARGISTK